MVLDALMILVVFIQSLFGGLVLSGSDTSTALPVNATTTAVVTHIVDGDTIDVRIGSSSAVTRVRYIGINTPEPYPKNTSKPECGSHEATVANRQLVEGHTVSLVTDADAYDPYQRLLAYVYVGDVFINEELVRRGYATTLAIKPNTRYRNLFASLRDEAKQNRVGNWDMCPAWH